MRHIAVSSLDSKFSVWANTDGELLQDRLTSLHNQVDACILGHTFSKTCAHQGPHTVVVSLFLADEEKLKVIEGTWRSDDSNDAVLHDSLQALLSRVPGVTSSSGRRRGPLSLFEPCRPLKSEMLDAERWRRRLWTHSIFPSDNGQEEDHPSSPHQPTRFAAESDVLPSTSERKRKGESEPVSAKLARSSFEKDRFQSQPPTSIARASASPTASIKRTYGQLLRSHGPSSISERSRSTSVSSDHSPSTSTGVTGVYDFVGCLNDSGTSVSRHGREDEGILGEEHRGIPSQAGSIPSGQSPEVGEVRSSDVSDHIGTLIADPFRHPDSDNETLSEQPPTLHETSLAARVPFSLREVSYEAAVGNWTALTQADMEDAMPRTWPRLPLRFYMQWQRNKKLAKKKGHLSIDAGFTTSSSTATASETDTD